MNQYQLRRLHRKTSGGGGGGGGGNGAAVLAAMAGLSTNLQADNYFTGNYTSANVLIGNGTEGFDNGGIYHDVDLWLQGVPAGLGTVFVRRIVFQPTSFIPPGNWIVGTKQGMICGVVNGGSSSFMHITQQGTDSPSQNLRDATFTIDDLGILGDYSGIVLNVTVKAPASGGPFNCKDLFVGLASDYASWLSGVDSSAAWRANNALIRTFKDADLVGQNTAKSYITRASQLVSFTRSYQGTENRSYGRVSKQIKELGTNAVHQPVFPYVWEEYLFSSDIASNSITRVGFGSAVFTPRSVGDTIVLYGAAYDIGPIGGFAGGTTYYIVQILGPDQWRVSLTQNGTPVTVTENYTPSNFDRKIVYTLDPYPVYLAIAQQLYAANPTGLFNPQATNEPWNNDYYLQVLRSVSSVQGGQPYNYGAGMGYRLAKMWKAMQDAGFNRNQVLYTIEGQNAGAGGFTNLVANTMDWVITDPSFNFGKKISDLMDAVQVASYPHPYDSGGNQIGAIELMFNGAIGFTPAQWNPFIQRGIDAYTPNATGFRAALDAKRPNTPIVMYEGDPSDEGVQIPPGSLNFLDRTVTGVTVASPGRLAVAAYGGVYTGMPLTVNSSGTKPGGLTAQAYYFVHSSSTTTSIVLAATYAAAFGGAAIAITTAGSGTISLTMNGQQILDFNASYQAYKASSARTADWTYYLQKIVHDGFKSRNLCVYSMTGNSSASTVAVRYFTQKRYDGFADSPAVAYLKSYTGWATSP